ncbi:MAG: MTH1187 family thiamine-binding protein [Planctomycetota bacterium]
MVLLEMSLTPLGEGESVSRAVAACVDLIDRSGLSYELHSMGTIVEGELPEVMALLQRCMELLAAEHARVTCIAKFDYRRGAKGRLRSKVESVEAKLGRSAGR